MAAYTILSFIPGLGVFMGPGQSLSCGMGVAVFGILGGPLSRVIVMTASCIGWGVLLAGSSQAFHMPKGAGVG
ncbi:hypothetical protein [Roseobacter weihaiensis]|uniref:hypothetical protein n=1 Tax=Roseobacter weihaiensis TaxID=2763262 RepID=UPI001D09BB7E|nr:hypothetical protein [Roseobacter sp. H9]